MVQFLETAFSFSQSESVDAAFYNLFALAELTNGRVAVVYSALIAGSNKLRMRVFTLSSSSLGSIYTRDITGESSGYSGGLYHAWVNVYIDNVGWIDNFIYFDGHDWSLMDPTFASSGGQSESLLIM